MIRIISIFLISFTLFSCGGGKGETRDTNSAEYQQAQNYVNEIVQIMKEHAITRDEVDWGNLESEVNTIAAKAFTIQETYAAVTKALELLGTNHSFLTTDSGRLLANYNRLVCSQSLQMNEPQTENVGYIRVDGYTTSSDSSDQEFATNIQKQISEQDSASLDGWVVDLRNNSGGNMWPMIAGLGPLLGNGVLGHFFDVNENIESWSYENGSSYLGENKVVTVEEPYTLLNPLPKIAVLSSRRAVSSGEASLIAFKKQYNVKSFGTDSCGLPTGNQAFVLSDGSILYLTTTIMADREQGKYGNSVPVDQTVDASEVINKAIEWLQNN